MTLLGAVFALLGLVAVVARPSWLPWLLSAAIAFPMTAAVVAGGTSLSPFYLLAGLSILAVVNLIATPPDFLERKPTPGRAALLGFAFYAAAITAAGPWLFAGESVLPPRAGLESVAFPAPLTYTVSNAAQLLYLLLAVAVVLHLGHLHGLPRNLLTAGLALGTVLSSARWVADVAGLPWPTAVFDNSLTVSYIDSTFDGAYRLRGVFSEPSELATFTLMALAYFVSAAYRSAGRARLLNGVLAGLAVFNLAQSYSGTAVVALAVLAVLAVGPAVFRATTRLRITAVSYVGFVAVLGALYWFGGDLLRLFSDLIDDKLGSTSYSTRSASDVFSLRLLGDTYGFGVGLGSNRSSSFATTLASCAGVVGFVLFAVAGIAVARRAWRVEAARPAVWALVALLIGKAVAAPDLSTPALWVALAVCANAAWREPAATQVAALATTRQVQS